MEFLLGVIEYCEFALPEKIIICLHLVIKDYRFYTTHLIWHPKTTTRLLLPPNMKKEPIDCNFVYDYDVVTDLLQLQALKFITSC